MLENLQRDVLLLRGPPTSCSHFPSLCLSSLADFCSSFMTVLFTSSFATWSLARKKWPELRNGPTHHVSRSSSRRQTTDDFARHSRFCLFLFGCGFCHLSGPVGLFDRSHRNDLFCCLHQQRAAHGSLGISFRPIGAKTDFDATRCLNYRLQCHLHLFSQ